MVGDAGFKGKLAAPESCVTAGAKTAAAVPPIVPPATIGEPIIKGVAGGVEGGAAGAGRGVRCIVFFFLRRLAACEASSAEWYKIKLTGGIDSIRELVALAARLRAGEAQLAEPRIGRADLFAATGAQCVFGGIAFHRFHRSSLDFRLLASAI